MKQLSCLSVCLPFSTYSVSQARQKHTAYLAIDHPLLTRPFLPHLVIWWP